MAQDSVFVKAGCGKTATFSRVGASGKPGAVQFTFFLKSGQDGVKLTNPAEALIKHEGELILNDP